MPLNLSRKTSKLLPQFQVENPVVNNMTSFLEIPIQSSEGNSISRIVKLFGKQKKIFEQY